MVTIKDMEMPKSCAECGMKKRCEYGIAGGWRENRRVYDCPLVEIITCKDCKHFYCIAECPSIKVCGLHNGAMRISEKFYCADAERRD